MFMIEKYLLLSYSYPEEHLLPKNRGNEDTVKIPNSEIVNIGLNATKPTMEKLKLFSALFPDADGNNESDMGESTITINPSVRSNNGSMVFDSFSSIAC